MANESTASATSATINGVTFNFNKSLEVGTFSLTDPDDVNIFVVNTTGGFEITSVTPTSTVLNGAYKDGLVKNPYFNSTDGQGFDEILEDGVASYIASANCTYNAALNIDPTKAAANVVVAESEEASYVKSVRLASVTDGDSWQTIEKYVTLHVLTAAPILGAYPPSASATTKTIWSQSDLNLSVVRAITFPASFTESAADLKADLPTNLGVYGLGGEYLRRMRLDVALGTTTSNYSAEIVDQYSKALMALHETGVNTTDRDEIIDKAVQYGIQIYGLIQRGAGFNFGAGQGGGIGIWLYYAAALLNDSAMWTAAKELSVQTVTGQWIASGDVGRVAGGKSGSTAQTAFDDHVGMPMLIPDEWGTNEDTRYGNIASFIVAYEQVAIWMINDTPETTDGAAGILNGATANDTGSQRAASIAYVDKYRTHTPFVGAAYDPQAVWRDMYDTVQPLTGLTAWTGKPEQIPREESTFTAGDGSILWTLTASLDWATETITQYDMRYSIDNVQWIENLNATNSSSKTGLLKGAPHWCGLRQVSASGNGVWSLNYPEDLPITSGTDRNKVTTTGTTTAAIPANTTAPIIHSRLAPAWGYTTWKPESGTLGVDDTELAAGVGYWSGYPAPTYTYQWKRDAVNISGETNQTYNRAAADAETSITCEVTATNSEGAVSATTAGVTAPAIQNPPSGTLIDTNFRGTFVIDYATEWGNVSTNGATAVHEPTQSFSSVDDLDGLDVSYGAIKVDKTSSYPSMILPLSRDLEAGKTYTLIAQIVATEDWQGTLGYDFRKTADSVSYLDGGAVSGVAVDAAEVTDLSLTFTVGSSETNLSPEFRIAHSTATGGSGGGDPYLTKLKVSLATPKPNRSPLASSALLI